VELPVETLEATLGCRQRLAAGKAVGGGERATGTATVAKQTAVKRTGCATHGSALAVADWVETVVNIGTQTWPSLVCISPDR